MTLAVIADRGLLAAITILAACERSAPIESCSQDLGGTYLADDKRWMVLDHGATLEAYPLFPDLPAIAGLESAPRVIDLTRDATAITGYVRRRYLRETASCEAAIPAKITACAGDALDIVLADPTPPLQFQGPFTVGLEPSSAPATESIEVFAIHFTRPLCAFPRADSNRRERWQRIR